MTEKDLLTILDKAAATGLGENKGRMIKAQQLLPNYKDIGTLDLLLAGAVGDVYVSYTPANEMTRTLRQELLDLAEKIRDVAVEIEIPDGNQTFKMSQRERDNAYKTLQDYTKKKGTDHIRKIVVIELSMPGNWGAAFSDGMEAFINARCPDRWIAYDVHEQAYVDNMGGLRLDKEDNGRNLSAEESFIEICRVE